MRRIRFLPFILAVSLTICACTKQPTNEGEPLDTTINSTNKEENENQSKLDALKPGAYGNVEGLTLEPGTTISIIGKYADDSFWDEIEAGAERAVTDMNSMLGYTGDQKIKLSYSAPDVRDDVDSQVSILDEELARYPAAIGIASVDSTACFVQFDLAEENSIPIVTFDSGSKYPDIDSHISTNNAKATKVAAKEMAKLMGEEGELAIFVQDSFSMSAREREKSFKKYIREHYPDIKIVKTYRMDQLEKHAKAIARASNKKIDPASLSHKDIIAHILEKNPNLKAVYATNLDTTQMVADALQSFEREDLYFVGFDGGEAQLDLLENDILDGLIVQNPYGMGYATVIAAARSVLNLGNEAYVNSGFVWVTKENMQEANISKMLY